jgi:translocator protein
VFRADSTVAAFSKAHVRGSEPDRYAHAMNDRHPWPLYDDDPRPPPGWWWLLALMLLLIGLGATMGILFGPDMWYERLHKPSWNPPGAVYGPVWTLLYALMGVSIWLVRRDRRSEQEIREHATWLFVLQLAVNLCWTPLLFGLRSPLLAFLSVCLLWCLLFATVHTFWKVRRLAGALMLPYLTWVTFALILNGTLWWMNR